MGFGAPSPRAPGASRDAARRSLPSSSSSSAIVAMMLVTARPVGVLVSTPSRRDRTWTPRLVSSWRAVATSRTEPVDGDDQEVIAFAELPHAPRPAGSVATSATGCGVGEHPVGGDASRREGVVLLIDRLLPG